MFPNSQEKSTQEGSERHTHYTTIISYTNTQSQTTERNHFFSILYIYKIPVFTDYCLETNPQRNQSISKLWYVSNIKFLIFLIDEIT